MVNPLHSPAYAALLQAGPRLGPLQQAQAHLTVSGLHRRRSLLTKLLTLLCSAGAAASAASLVPSVPDPDTFLFSSLIRASAKSNQPIYSIFFYRQMLFANLQPSNFTFTAAAKACADLSASVTGRLIHAHALIGGYSLDCYVQTAFLVFYAKSGDLDMARKLFDDISPRSIVAWNAMISGYEQNGLASEAVEVFRMMHTEGVVPDPATFVGVLSACSQLGDLALGQWVDGYIVNKNINVGVILGSSLINMYARCGNVEKARGIFEKLQEKNVIVWTAMIAGYGMHGYGKEAVEIFRRMRLTGTSPNDVTFVALLSACAHAGMVGEARDAFFSMKKDYGVVPKTEHFVCMVDLFGRAGLLSEAMEFIKACIKGEPGASVWTAMLGACKMHKNFDLGVEVAERLLKVEPDDPAHYVLISNVYASAGRMDLVENIRNVMIYKRLKKQTGYSLIEIDRKSHMFRMGDTSHPKTAEIYRFLEELICRIRKTGYRPETESVMHELEEEEREYALRFHSEKLAVAFGIMSTSEFAVIRITKNLRICDDCHLAIRFITGVTKREITIRDTHRFHHFKDGLCSCQDYW